MKYSLTASFAILSVLGSVSALEIRCRQGYEKSYEMCKLQKLEFSSSQAKSLNFPVFAGYEMVECSVDYLSPEIMDRMPWISKLSIIRGTIPKIYLKPDLLTLTAKQSQTVEIVISSNNSLTRLEISSNHLNAIPTNISQLKSLSLLNLNSNEIQYLNFSDFNGMDNLTEINLSSNKLYAVTCDREVMLEKLATLDLSNNFLVELDFHHWQLPVLHTLSVKSNSLKVIINFDETTFPKLKLFQYSENAWDCRWSNAFASTMDSITKHTMHQTSSRYGEYRKESLPLVCAKHTQLSASRYRQLNLTAIDDAQFKFDNPEELEEQLLIIVEDSINHSADIGLLKETVTAQQTQIDDLLKQSLEQQTLLSKLNDKVQSLEEQLKTLKLPTISSSLPENLAEKIILEVSYVIRKTIRNDL
ncbi:leucine-rich repeats and immunoglobulin-like domains protein 1 [Wyeomyia smithii]|uniref:leucine-rich repeats and immunoglobulin-like domains protein 1 n=1 Tax=Wyeomyia smithii TaxID=174621 RepID=UPI002467F0FE|nr:leucine-rich repeats and immunoglobulin-like domains protein 1 [Wyeomyia smithii]